MTQNQKLKLLISYSHEDEQSIDDFRKHISVFKTNKLIDDWYDRKIMAGERFQDDIDNNLESSDIICLFISANFMSSTACLEEKKKALKLREEKGISVVPIILSSCGWKDDKDISCLQALPTDATPIKSYQDSDEAWTIVYEGLKEVIEKQTKIKQLKITEQFSSFLQDAELLTKAHSQKGKIILDDIFIYPDLDKYDSLGEEKETENAEQLIENICKYSKILIAGENQSGKTTLCKRIFNELRKKDFVPVYVSDKDNQHKGGLEANILESYKEQYQNTSISEINKRRIVPIIDNFHLAKHKEKYISDLSSYQHQIIIVDDIFSLNFEDENLISSFTQFKIREFAPLLRNQLIQRWTQLTDKNHTSENDKYKNIDETTELINATLGLGIVPKYPFFIISIISTYETFQQPLEKEITSQGYCYQALIYIYLRKQEVKNDEIEIYINFLTEFAFYLYKEQKNELSVTEFDDFINQYSDKYILPIEQEILLNKLKQSQIIKLDSFNNTSFCYEYIYYFFTAKYLAEHLKDNKDIIESIVNNLHKDENAYIAIFTSHHSKNSSILDDIELNAMCLFDKYKPATLRKEELTFFDKKANIIVNAALPSHSSNPEKERIERLKHQGIAEEKDKNKQGKLSKEGDENSLAIELRRSIKTVEVMGRIIKNRAGSLEKSRLEAIFKEAVEVYLRILTSFFDVIKNENGEKEITDFIADRLNKIIEKKAEERRDEGKKARELDKDILEKISKEIFWNSNFFFVYGLMRKIINSLGSNKLIEIVEKICNKENTPAYFLIKHGISMWYNKNLLHEDIIKNINNNEFSETAKKTMRFMVVDHCSMHSIKISDKQKIANKLNIPLQRLLPYNSSKENKSQ